MVNKCNNCGVEYWESLAECPYCGIPNLRHPQFLNSVKNGNAYERMMEHKNKEQKMIE
jgi:rRNA maturation endonuclease Nob1